MEVGECVFACFIDGRILLGSNFIDVIHWEAGHGTNWLMVVSAVTTYFFI
jgi:hypothetical protein